MNVHKKINIRSCYNNNIRRILLPYYNSKKFIDSIHQPNYFYVTGKKKIFKLRF
jgi:hypothetical protein